MADINKDLFCDVCSGNQFSLNEGFYYCDECGTQLRQVIDLNLEEDYVEDLSRLERKVIKKDTSLNKVDITSWEVLNYILRGLVDELIGLGAKEELKDAVLQIWAALLRHHKVAFFNKKHSELPQLGLRFCDNDVKVIYNHKVGKEKKKRDRKRRLSSAKRELQKQKKLLELSEYEEFSRSEASISTLSNSMSLNSSTSGNSNKAARLTFLPYARKHFKKMMGSKHLAKHELDNEQSLSCHNLKVRRKELSRPEMYKEISKTTIYAILYIALNSIEDDIQLSDLRRYILEGRLSLQHIRKFFPENIAAECMKICSSINYIHSMKAHMPSLRMEENIFHVRSRLSIPELKLPSITRLCQRYITELALPKDLFKFVERLINIYKPEMRWGGRHPPFYEGRAMAYIIFILKLLFGLDDSMEHEISESSRKINETVSRANLFVFDDWLRYLEMRKVILSQAYMPFSVAYKIDCDSHRRFEFLKREYSEEDALYFRKPQMDNLNVIIESFLSKFHQDEPEEFDFSHPTLTPNSTYFQTVLDSTKKIFIPDFMHRNPSESSIEAFIAPKELKILANDNMFKLKVEELELREHVQIGKFNNHRKRCNSKWANCRVRKVDFDIDLSTWEKEVEEERVKRASTFETEEIQLSSQKRRAKINRQEKQSASSSRPMEEHINVKREHLFECFSDNEDGLFNGNENFEEIAFKISKMEYWSVMGSLKDLTHLEIEAIKKKLPITLKWLVGYCAHMLDVNWEAIYQELLTIEVTFLYVLEPMDSVTNLVKFKDSIDMMLNTYRLAW